MEYKQEGESDRKKGQRTAHVHEGVQGRGGGAGRKEGEANQPDSGSFGCERERIAPVDAAGPGGGAMRLAPVSRPRTAP
jgi:hypothetical protein